MSAVLLAYSRLMLSTPPDTHTAIRELGLQYRDKAFEMEAGTAEFDFNASAIAGTIHTTRDGSKQTYGSMTGSMHHLHKRLTDCVTLSCVEE